MWYCKHNQQKIEKTKENGMTTKVEDVTIIQMTKFINKKGALQIKGNLQTKAVTKVIVQAKENELEGSPIKTMQCYNFQKYGHYVNECSTIKKNNQENDKKNCKKR